MNTELKEHLEEALASAEPEAKLEELVEQLKQENWNQIEIYILFESFMVFLQEEERDKDEDTIVNVLDFIWGWCPPSARWFPRSLSNGEVHQYKQFKQGER